MDLSQWQFLGTIALLILLPFAILFQLALALGAPWGEYAMGGRYPGRFPRPMRVAAAVQAVVLGVFLVIVTSRIGWIDSPLDAPWLLWLLVAFFAVSIVVNAISKSRLERALWTPIAIVLFASSLALAVGTSGY